MADDDYTPAARINTSLETLRTEIALANAQLEIRITDKVASREAVQKLETNVQKLTDRVDNLDEDKAGREAVKAITRYFIGGGVLTTLIMLCQLALTFYLTTHAG